MFPCYTYTYINIQYIEEHVVYYLANNNMRNRTEYNVIM